MFKNTTLITSEPSVKPQGEYGGMEEANRHDAPNCYEKFPATEAEEGPNISMGAHRQGCTVSPLPDAIHMNARQVSSPFGVFFVRKLIRVQRRRIHITVKFRPGGYIALANRSFPLT